MSQSEATKHLFSQEGLEELLNNDRQCGSCGNDVPAGFLTKHDVCLLCVKEKMNVEAVDGTH